MRAGQRFRPRSQPRNDRSPERTAEERGALQAKARGAAERARPRQRAAESPEQHGRFSARNRCERLRSERPQGAHQRHRGIDPRGECRARCRSSPQRMRKQARPESATPRRRPHGASRCAQIRHLGPRQQRAAAPEQTLDDRRGRPPHGSAAADIHPDSRDARAADQDTVRSRRRARRAARRGRRGASSRRRATSTTRSRGSLHKRRRFSCP